MSRRGKRTRSATDATVKLNNGVVMPMIGLGTWKSPLGKTGAAVKEAIAAGYRLIDTANDYNNEHEIGQALKEVLDSGMVKREELFIQSKLWNTNHRRELVKPDLMATLEDLQLSYVDCFVIHWPQASPSNGTLAVRKNGAHPAPTKEGTMFPINDDGLYASDNKTHFLETWEAMEDLVDAGLARCIGLSNFNRAQVEEILKHTRKHKPVVLQNECHPYLQQKDLVDFCKIHDIVFQGYSPLGSYDRPWAKPGDKELLDDDEIKALAESKGKTPAQIVLRWNIQRGVSVVPKSVTPERIRQNFDLFDFELTAEEMAGFDRFNRGWRHLLWPETSMHPDYPFKDDLPHDSKPPKAATKAAASSR